MHSKTFGKKVLFAILIFVLSATMVIPNFGCCDCYYRDVDPGRFSSSINRQYVAPNKNTGSNETPKSITPPANATKKNITDEGSEQGTGGTSGGYGH